MNHHLGTEANKPEHQSQVSKLPNTSVWLGLGPALVRFILQLSWLRLLASFKLLERPLERDGPVGSKCCNTVKARNCEQQFNKQREQHRTNDIKPKQRR